MAKGLRRLSHAHGGQVLPFSSSEGRDIGHHRLGLLRQPLISPGFLSAGAPPSSLTVLHHGLPQQTQASRCLLSQAWVRDDYLPFGFFPGLFPHIVFAHHPFLMKPPFISPPSLHCITSNQLFKAHLKTHLLWVALPNCYCSHESLLC